MKVEITYCVLEKHSYFRQTEEVDMTSDPIVETRSGKLRGQNKNGLLTFKGIPFAAPPIGELRWRAPEREMPWTGIRDALAFSPAAPQDQTPLMRVGETNEDCLYLNIWTPSLTGKRPVMFWIHGGGFLIGSASQREYNGRRLAMRGDVVVVSINYRLGALGFADWRNTLGGNFFCETNLGLRDQIAGLEWVREHIAHFGGDHNNVTIFGESAGGMSVATLLATNAAGKLFHKAIAQSGASYHYIPSTDAEKVAAKLLAALDIAPSQSQKLRQVSADDIVKAQRRCVRVPVRCGPWRLPMLGMNFLPVVGDDLLPECTQTRIAKGHAQNVPLLTGTTREEWRLFSTMARMAPPEQRGTAMIPGAIAPEKLEEAFEQRVPGYGANLLAGYRKLAGANASAEKLDEMLESDRIFFVPMTRMAMAQAKTGAPTYVYRFDYASPLVGAAHAIDIPFVFGDVDSPFGKMFTGGGPEAQKLSDAVQDAWLNFARTGTPKSADLPAWPAYDSEERSTMVIDKTCRVENKPLSDHLALWADIV